MSLVDDGGADVRRTYGRPGGGGGFALPPLSDWMKKLLGGLLGLYILELVLRAAGMPVHLLGWVPLSHGMMPWQPLTRFLLQGNDVVGVLFGLLILYFFLPPIAQRLKREQLIEVVLSMAATATVVPLLYDLLFGATGGVVGWNFVLTGLVCLFGLMHPEAEILLFFVLPIRAVWFVWGTLFIDCMIFLSALSSGGTFSATEQLGSWLGAYAWWHTRGPAGRRRTLIKKAANIEKKLGFEVHQGGKAQGDQETWH